MPRIVFANRALTTPDGTSLSDCGLMACARAAFPAGQSLPSSPICSFPDCVHSTRFRLV